MTGAAVIRRCAACGALIRRRTGNGRGWMWCNGLCPRCEMRDRRARAALARAPRLLRSGSDGYSPLYGTSRGTPR